MELSFKSVFTRTHELRAILRSLPLDSAVRQTLLEAWSNPASSILQDYAGINNPSGENNSRKMRICF